MDARSQFGPVAEAYLKSGVHSNEAALARLVEIADPKGGTVLDVATGAGHTAFAFARHVDQVLASDITPEMLAVVRKAAMDRGLSNVQTLFAAAENLPVGKSSLHGITCRLGAHHFRDVARFLQQVRAALRPGGWFVLADTVGIEDGASDEGLHQIELARDPSHMRNLPPSQWLHLAERAGLQVAFSEVVPKPLNAADWFERMRVAAADRTRIVELIEGSKGWLREYLRPHGSGPLLTFHLHEIVLFARAS